jgi:tetratricopeptide (TPR) repeat protein
VNSTTPSRRDPFSLLLFAALLACACHPTKRLPSEDHEDGKAQLQSLLSESMLGSKALFLPPGCLGLLKDKPSSVRISSPAQSAEAISNPASFHALNREYRFDRVFLLPGPICSPLRDRLLDSPVWLLSRVRPEGYLFTVAGSTPWHAPDAAEAASLVPDPGARSLWLIGTAENLIAIGHLEEATSLLNLATCSKKHEALRLAALSSVEAACGHWNKALDIAGQSLRIDRHNRTATMILIRGQAETGHSEEALSKARDFVQTSPDAESLFLLARAANEAGDHTEEINALRRLVVTAKEQHQPAGASLLYLGQALARDGQRGEALRALEEAEKAPELTEEQKRLIRELSDHLAPGS